MHFGIPIAAHGCAFNRYTTEDRALYFNSAEELRALVSQMTAAEAEAIGEKMREISSRRYSWATIGRAYFELLEA